MRYVAVLIARWSIAAALINTATQPSLAQVVLPLKIAEGPPWSALNVFEPIPFAQFWDPDRRDEVAVEDKPVLSRQQPGYESVGLRVGPTMFDPSLTIGSRFDSNVFSSNTNTRSDIVMQVNPMLRWHTLWERHALELQADVRSDFYRSNPGLDQTDASFKGRGRFDISHDSAILSKFQAALLNEGVGTLSSPAGAVEPTPYRLLSGDATYWKQFNRLSASFGTRVDSYDYGSTRAQNGSIISQDSRDGQVYVAHGRFDYVVSPLFGVFTAFEANKRDLRGTPTQPISSNGYRALAGANFELTHLITGEVGAGYASQRFDSAAIGTIEGPAYRAVLNWSPTRQIDVKFKAEQIVTEASDTDASGIRADAFQLGVDYEFRRNVVVSTSVTYENDKFFGLARRDDVFATSSELKYLLNRFSSISLQHRYIKRDSNVPTSSFDKHVVGVNVTAQF